MEPYDAVLDALGDRTRRAVLDRLRAGPLPVVEIARDLPVSRPAVSQHLKVLKDAGLVVDRQEGTRRIYALDPDGLSLLRAYAEAFWQGPPPSYAQPANAIRDNRPEQGEPTRSERETPPPVGGGEGVGGSSQ